MSVSGSAPRRPRGHDLDLGHALGEAQRGLERVGEPALDARPAHEPVDDDLDRVVLVAGRAVAAGRASSTSSPSTRARVKPCAGELVEQRRRTRPCGPAPPARAPGSGCPRASCEHAVDDLLRGLAGDQPPAVRAVRHADARVQQPQVVVDLGDRADGRARVARRRLLVDRDRRRQALDEVDVGLVHLPEELPGVRRQRLDVAALALGVDRVERERRLARARQPGEDDQLVARQLEVDVLQVVLARAPHDDRVVGRSLRRRRPGLGIRFRLPAARAASNICSPVVAYRRVWSVGPCRAGVSRGAAGGRRVPC